MKSIGIDIGATNVRFGQLQENQLVKQSTAKTQHDSPETLAHQCQEIADSVDKNSLLGIAIPGPLDEHGVLHNPPNFPGWGEVNFKEVLKKKIDRPFVLERDSVAALFAEWKLGAAKAKNNVVLLTIGTGIGGAAVIDGKILRGEHGYSGEFGHVTIGKTGRTCGLGHDGCAEAWSSGKALEEGVSLDEATDVFARLLQSMEVTFDPELIVLTGGLTTHETYVADSLKKAHDLGLQVEVKVGEFGEWAGVAGAGLLAREHRD